MAVKLVENGYGKQAVRLVTVHRGDRTNQLKDVTVAVRFEGDFEAAYTEGDNQGVFPTDTMKNTVYALAAQHPFEEIEDFGFVLADHYWQASSRTARVQVDLTEHLWEPIGEEGDRSFRKAGSEKRKATVTRDREGTRVRAGIEDLVVMKTSRSAFEGFPRDHFTTLPETADRLLATAVQATWLYASSARGFGALWRELRRRLLEAFAKHESRSVQHTLHAMGEAALEMPEIEEIRLVMPNLHHIPVNLEPFGLENRNEVFVATPEPYGLIEGTMRRS